MDGRGEELDRGRGEELGCRQARDVAPHRVGEPGVHPRGQETRQVEGGEDGQAVAHGEEEVAGQRDGPGHSAGGPEEADEDLVLVDAQADVCGGRGGELAGAGGDGGGGAVGHGGGGGVERVGRHVGAGVEGEDEGAGAREQQGLGPGEERAKRGADGVGEGVAARGVFHDGAARTGQLGAVWHVRERERVGADVDFV